MGTLILQDGSVIKGNSFGAIGGYEGEIVFNTSMTGYQEIFTDSGYKKQIVVLTYPEIGNYGINDFDFESDSSSLVGLVVKNNCKQESHYKSRESLSNFLKKRDIIALSDVDTRSLVRKIRELGTMNAFITSNDLDNETINQVLGKLQKFQIDKDVLQEVSCQTRYVYNPQGKINIALIDYGVKRSLLNELAQRNCRITIYPAYTEAKEILDNDFDALFLSNGPGNPENYGFQVAQIKQFMNKILLFGIDLGYELLALASGAKIYKLKQGHRGGNYPVINLENNKVMMTSQNHSYAVDIENITRFMRPTYKNLNDGTLEGFEIDSLGVYAVQFHPEGKPGPTDATYIFDEWINIIKRDINKINEVKNER